VSAPSAEAVIVETLNRFAEHVNRGEVAAAIGHFTDDPSIVEDLSPFHWRGPDAAGAWLAAMAANAERNGVTGIHMGFRAPRLVLVDGDRGYAVLPGDLSYSFAGAPDRRIGGYVTFAVQKIHDAWKIETLTWTWEHEAAT